MDNSLDDLKKCFKKIEDLENSEKEDDISSIRGLFKGGERFSQPGYSLQEAPLSYGYKIIFISLYFEIRGWFLEKNHKTITSVETSNIELNGEDDGITFASDAVKYFFEKIEKIIKSQADIQCEKLSALGIFEMPASEFIQYPNELLNPLKINDENYVRINQKKDGKNVDELNGVYVTHQAFIHSSDKFNPASYDRKDIFLLKMFPEQGDKVIESFMEALAGAMIKNMCEKELIPKNYHRSFVPAHIVKLPDLNKWGLWQSFLAEAAPLFQLQPSVGFKNFTEKEFSSLVALINRNDDAISQLSSKHLFDSIKLPLYMTKIHVAHPANISVER